MCLKEIFFRVFQLKKKIQDILFLGVCWRLIPIGVVGMKGIDANVNTAHEELEGFTHEEYF